MKKIIYISIFVIALSFFGAFAPNVNADQVGSVQVSAIIGEQNANLLDQSLSAVGGVLDEIQLMIGSNSTFINDNSIAISDTLSGVGSVLSSIDMNVTQLAYEYVDNNSFAGGQNNDIAGNGQVAPANDLQNDQSIPAYNAQNENENGLASVSSVYGGGIVISVIILLILLIGIGVWMLFRENKRSKKINVKNTTQNTTVNPNAQTLPTETTINNTSQN